MLYVKFYGTEIGTAGASKTHPAAPKAIVPFPFWGWDQSSSEYRPCLYLL